MKEDMGMFGDELSNAKALYTAGYVSPHPTPALAT
jgi:hypothetical protein